MEHRKLTIKQRKKIDAIADEIAKERAARHLKRLPNKKRHPRIVQLLKRLHSTDMTPDELESLDDEVLDTLGESTQSS